LARLRPWVDVGSVGSLALARLAEHLHIQELGSLARPGNFFDFTRYRPTLYYAQGRRQVSIPNTFIGWAKGLGDHDFIFFHLLEPHMMGELYSESVLKVMERLGVRRYCLLGAIYDMVPHTRPLLISGSAIGVEAQRALERLGIKPSGYQGPTTIAILISQQAPQRGIETMTTIVHLPQYAQSEEDHAGELCLLEFLSSLYGFSLDLERVREKAQRQYNEISLAVERDPRFREMVSQLENYYDARASKAPVAPQTPRLSPEIEQFLREIDKRFGQGS